ncbi:hypothetical protein OOT46_25110 [Aquabacterium sp. A7-Y]|nr:hypothetical protein [Aquabacterium sp. A7-Y]MCW7541098.1 hypothetical protein [Aquabacterium sp. A7-Y]
MKVSDGEEDAEHEADRAEHAAKTWRFVDGRRRIDFQARSFRWRQAYEAR